MLVKSLLAEQQLDHLRQAFEVLQKYNMKLNPTKCSFGVVSDKFLGYMVTQHGIKANLDQIWSVMNIPSPAYVQDVQRLAGYVAALSCLISHFSESVINSLALYTSPKTLSGHQPMNKHSETGKGT